MSASRTRSRSKPVVFGERYWLTRPLAVGGMAEIFLAKYEGADGFTKDVVIKRLRAELAKDPRIIAMFRDEARVSGMLNHANVVHVFDSGTHEGLPFMAMEFFAGEELNALCKRGIGCGEFLPLEHAVDLVRQAALGMGYYHNLRDTSGQNLDLIHCDISPNNLLVGKSGYLQIIDFGISQYRGQEYRDDQLVPGKLSYMSPEQAKRERLDHRSDIFALGIVLYEIALGRRLFRGPANEVLPRVIKGDIKAPTFIRQDFPAALEAIIMRALETEPSDRYQEAYDFADALGNYLREEQMRTGPIGVARYLDRLAVAGGGSRRDEFISELEQEDGDDLNFDRGLFRGFQAMPPKVPLAAQSWEDEEEEESAIADALGIDVNLVRTASKAPEGADDAEMNSTSSANENPEKRDASDFTAEEKSLETQDSPSSEPLEAQGKQDLIRSRRTRDSSEHVYHAQVNPPSQAGVLMLVLFIGVGIGIGGAFLLGLLG